MAWSKTLSRLTALLERTKGLRPVEKPPVGMETLEDRTTPSTVPTLAPIEDVTLFAGSPLHIPLDGFDADAQALSFAAVSDNSLVSTTIPEGNRSLRVSVAGFGVMVFELFDGRAPRVTEHITELAESGFYDGLTFHRVIDGFVIQAGDPTGTGTGGSALGDFDDQFNLELQHNRSGVLSMAKTFDDTNDSQFFITEAPERHLDFNHSVFGQLIEGEAVREAISGVPTDESAQPLTDVVIDSVDVFFDEQNGVLMLSAPEGTSGEANVTVTVTDESGLSAQQTFHVTVTPDQFHGSPFLSDIPPIKTTVNAPVTFQLEANNVGGDGVVYLGEQALAFNNLPVPVASHPDLYYSVDHTTGIVTVIPTNGLTGTHSITVAVAMSVDAIDYQVVPITIEAATDPMDGPTAVGVFRGGVWSLDSDASLAFGSDDPVFGFGAEGDTPVVGDWNGDGLDQIGYFRGGQWTFDLNGNGHEDAIDLHASFGAADDVPLVGDWNGDGVDQIGIFRRQADGTGLFVLDSNGNFAFEPGDETFVFGLADDTVVVGDWNGDGVDQFGVFRPHPDGSGAAQFSLDFNNDHNFVGGDRVVTFGLASDTIVVGDWGDTGQDKLGVYRPHWDFPSAAVFSLDSNGDLAFDDTDDVFTFGLATDQVVVGRWAAQLSASEVLAEQAVDAGPLGEEQLGPIVEEALSLWEAAGVDSELLAALRNIDVRVGDLAGSTLALAAPAGITIDADAAGYGWFVDATPGAHEEFTLQSGGELVAAPEGPAAGRYDLLTVMTHELGHALGLNDVDPLQGAERVMAASLRPGVRRTPQAIDALFASDLSNPADGEWS